MKVMVTFSFKPENVKATLARFKEGGAKPSEGAELLGRWHEVGTGHGFALFEVTNPTAFTGFLMGWADLGEQHAVPVVEDADIAANL